MRRILLLLGVVIVGAGVLFYVTRSSSNSASAPKTSHREVAVHVGKKSGKSHGAARARHSQRRVGGMSAQDRADRKAYAANLLPVLDHTRGVFDQAARATASAGSLGALGSQCTNYGSRASILETQVEGVPHPFVWYSPAGTLHHNILGIYHQMEGGAQACQTGAANGEGDAASAGVSDMNGAMHSMRRMDDYVRWLSHHG